MMDLSQNIRQTSFCLVTNDMQKIAAWYQDVFGFKIKNSKRFYAINAEVCYLSLGDMTFELLQSDVMHRVVRADPPHHGTMQGVSQLTFRIDDIDAVYAVLKNKHIEIAMEPIIDDDLHVKAMFIRDPEDNLIELLQEE